MHVEQELESNCQLDGGDILIVKTELAPKSIDWLAVNFWTGVRREGRKLGSAKWSWFTASSSFSEESKSCVRILLIKTP